MFESRYVAWTSTGVSVCFISYLLYDKFFKKKNDYVTESERNAEKLTKKEVLELRRKFFCDAQSISYENSNPLFATKGISYLASVKLYNFRQSVQFWDRVY